MAKLLAELALPDSADSLQRRRGAARQLSDLKPLPAAAIAPLAKALDTWDRGGLQRYASDALAGAGTRALPALAAECGRTGRDGEGCQASIGVLSRIAKSEPAAWPILIDDFQSGYGAGAAIEVGKLGAPVVPILRQALKSDNPKTRAMAARALYGIGPPAKDAIADLVPLLNDTAGKDTGMPAKASGEWPSPIVHDEAALALANIDPARKDALPVLLPLVSDHWMTGLEAIEVIGKMGNNAREAIPVLKLLADDSQNPNHSSAADALAMIEGCSAAPILARALKHDQDFQAARALADLGPDCPETIPALIAALSYDRAHSAPELARLGKPGLAALTPALQSPDLDVRKSVVEALSDLANKAPWVGKPEDQTRRLPNELVRPLMLAMNDPSITIREQAARALQFAGGEPQRLALAELDREDAIYQRESALDKTPRTREQITASITPDADNKYPLTIEYLFPIYESVGIREPQYLISLHRGRERNDRLVIWKKVDQGKQDKEDKYEQARVIESPGGQDPGRFLPPTVFRANVRVLGEGSSFDEGRQFVDIPQNGCNTWCVIDNVFAIENGELIPVQIESPEEWYKSRLKPGESTWNSNSNSFSTWDKLSFAFSIWTAEDSHASPSGGGVTGTYKIIKETTVPQPIAVGPGVFPLSPPSTPYPAPSYGPGHPLTTWKMVVDSAERKPALRP